MSQVGENGALPSLAEALKGRTSIKSIVEAKDEGLSNVGSSLLVAGWVRTGRQQGSGAHEPWAFLELNDGSTHANLQVHRWQDAFVVHCLQTVLQTAERTALTIKELCPPCRLDKVPVINWPTAQLLARCCL